MNLKCAIGSGILSIVIMAIAIGLFISFAYILAIYPIVGSIMVIITIFGAIGVTVFLGWVLYLNCKEK